MTRSQVPSYDESRTTNRGERAVVVGAGFAGLCTARVLADYFNTVTILDRDTLPESPAARDGVPQGEHPHMLRLAGVNVLEELLPGCVADVTSAGGAEIAMGEDLNVYAVGGYWASPATPYTLPSASRPLFEQVLRRRVLAFDGVELRGSHQCLNFVTDGSMDVRGVRVRNANNEEETLTADLVVDATGRTTKTPTWLDEHGYRSPSVEEVVVNVAYSTCLLERPSGDNRAIVVLPSQGGRAALVFPIENNRWFVTLIGRGDDQPPTDPEEFLTYADGIATNDVRELLDGHEMVSDEIAHYPFPSNRRYRFDELNRFPGGLAVIGDAVASFNPTYAQGMTVAALEAAMLHDVLADTEVDDVGLALANRIAPILETPWFLAVGFDSLFPETSGPVPDGIDTWREYITYVGAAMHEDGHVVEAFLKVSEMERPPTSLLDSTVTGRVFGAPESAGQSDVPEWVPDTISDAWPFIDEQLSSSDKIRSWPGFNADAIPQTAGDD